MLLNQNINYHKMYRIMCLERHNVSAKPNVPFGSHNHGLLSYVHTGGPLSSKMYKQDNNFCGCKHACAWYRPLFNSSVVRHCHELHVTLHLCVLPIFFTVKQSLWDHLYHCLMVCSNTYPINMTIKEMRLTTKNINTEYSQPCSLSLDTWNGRQTPRKV